MSREKLKDSQGAGNRFPKLEVNYRLRIKKNPEGQPAFEYYAKETSHYLTDAIEGIFIGAVNVLTCFDKSYGRKGGQFNSSYFLSGKDSIAIFDPGGNKVFKGNRDHVDSWANNQNMPGFKIRKRIILLNDKGIVFDIDTNMIIFIDQMNSFDKDTFKDYLISLTPSIFDVEENPIKLAKRSIEFLGPFIKENKPRYARIATSMPLDDQIWESYGGDGVADMFIAWKNGLQDNVDEETTDNKEQPESGKKEVSPDEDPEDDLPF